MILASTEANASVRDIHHRMPVVLPEEKIPAWIEDTGAA
ncbi:SOS response-associated peptidase [Zongyangia hominis]|nr:SOS response-associated peptidase [Zongyangia hominis]